MLKSDDPSVRYWGAKGLVGIAGDVKAVGGATLKRAVGALKEAHKVEKSPAVAGEIEKAMALY